MVVTYDSQRYHDVKVCGPPAASSSSSSTRRRHHRIASSGRLVAPPWPRRMACLQKLAGTDPVSLRSWSVQRARWWPGRRLQSPPSERPDASQTWQCRALCAGVHWVSRAMWPNTDKRRLLMKSITGGKPSEIKNVCASGYFTRHVDLSMSLVFWDSVMPTTAPNMSLFKKQELTLQNVLSLRRYVHLYGTLYLQISDLSLTLLFLSANLKVTCFVRLLFSTFIPYCDCMSSVRPSVRLSVCNFGGSGSHRLEILETKHIDN